MPGTELEELEKDSSELVGLDAPAKKDEQSPDPEPAPVAAKEEPEPEPTPAKKETPEWSKAYTRTQQEVSTLKNENKELNKKLDILLKHIGHEPEAEAAPTPTAPADTLASERDMEIQQLRQRVEFNEIRLKNPDADPDKMWDKAWDEALATYDIDPTGTTLPEGITRKALEKLADKNFQAQVKALPPKKAVAPAAPPSPQRRLPPKTPGGAGVRPTPESHVASPPNRLDDRAEMIRDCADLVGGAD